VLIPGDMGRYSFVLVGTEGAFAETFGSTCHGAGRRMSRHQAKKAARPRNISRELEDRGILIRAASKRTIDEEIPEAYKDVRQVVDVVHGAGIGRKVVKLVPIGVVKG
jgi:tRNA-splicing ligase RtcB